MHDGVNVQKTFNHSIMQFSICYNLNIIHVELSCFLKDVSAKPEKVGFMAELLNCP